MSFTVNLYKNNSKDNKYKKDLANVGTLTGTLRDKSSIINPVILCEFTGDNIQRCNYMYIERFERYYFVTDIVCVRNHLYEIHGHTDVLSSATNLGKCYGIIRRSENNWNLYLDDGVFKVYSNPNIIQKSFPSGFDLSNATYILSVAGS